MRRVAAGSHRGALQSIRDDRIARLPGKIERLEQKLAKFRQRVQSMILDAKEAIERRG